MIEIGISNLTSLSEKHVTCMQQNKMFWTLPVSQYSALVFLPVCIIEQYLKWLPTFTGTQLIFPAFPYGDNLVNSLNIEFYSFSFWLAISCFKFLRCKSNTGPNCPTNAKNTQQALQVVQLHPVLPPQDLMQRVTLPNSLPCWIWEAQLPPKKASLWGPPTSTHWPILYIYIFFIDQAEECQS